MCNSRSFTLPKTQNRVRCSPPKSQWIRLTQTPAICWPHVQHENLLAMSFPSNGQEGRTLTLVTVCGQQHDSSLMSKVLLQFHECILFLLYCLDTLLQVNAKLLVSGLWFHVTVRGQEPFSRKHALPFHRRRG